MARSFFFVFLQFFFLFCLLCAAGHVAHDLTSVAASGMRNRHLPDQQHLSNHNRPPPVTATTPQHIQRCRPEEVHKGQDGETGRDGMSLLGRLLKITILHQLGLQLGLQLGKPGGEGRGRVCKDQRWMGNANLKLKQRKTAVNDRRNNKDPIGTGMESALPICA